MMLSVRGRWQQFRLHEEDTFVCAGCDEKQSTVLVAVVDFDWSAPTCQHCYTAAVETEGAQRHTTPPLAGAQPPARPQRASRYRHDDFQALGDLLIAQASNRKLSESDTALIRSATGTGAHRVALAYAAAAIEAGLTPAHRAPGLVKRLRDGLRAAGDQEHRRRQAEIARHEKLARIDDPLEALVLNRLRPEAFRKALADVLALRKGAVSKLDLPAESLWHWLNIVRDQPHPTGPPDVIRLRTMTSVQFENHLIALAGRDKPSMKSLTHPVLVEQWERHAAAATRALRPGSHRASRAGMGRGGTKAAYARARALEAAANVEVENLRHRISMHGDPAKLRQRSALLLAAVHKVTDFDPALAAALRDVCMNHIAACAAARRGDSCIPCLPSLVKEFRARLTPRPSPPRSVLRQPAQPRPTSKPAVTPRLPNGAKPPEPPPVPLLGPDAQRRVRCLPHGRHIHPGTTRATWEVAVTREDLERGRCPLPDGTTLPSNDTLALNLQFQIREDSSEPQRVKLRSVDDAWELIGLQWPMSVQPGVFVMLTWPTGGTDVIAWTKPLDRPERINGVVYRAQFDRRTVTRELLPGMGQHRGTQTLSADGWVTRTLQVLGYLCPEGSATLAEDALARNCLSLGMPGDLTDRIPAATTKLIAEKKIRRVRGSRDIFGEPSYPARPGDPPVDLLRYLPSVQVLHPESSTGPASPGAQRPHKVHGFLRRLPDGAHASDAQLDRYHEAVAAAEIANHPIDPTRYTFVATHRRGTGMRE